MEIFKFNGEEKLLLTVIFGQIIERQDRCNLLFFSLNVDIATLDILSRIFAQHGIESKGRG